MLGLFWWIDLFLHYGFFSWFLEMPDISCEFYFFGLDYFMVYKYLFLLFFRYLATLQYRLAWNSVCSPIWPSGLLPPTLLPQPP